MNDPGQPRTGLRTRLRSALGLDGMHDRMTKLEQRLQRLETSLLESRDETWDRSRTRWRTATPSADLTWDVELTGDAFVEAATRHGALGQDRAILEVGPGYGRLLSAAIERGSSFASWTGLDISAENVRHLRERFPREDVEFVEGDIEQVRLDRRFDAIVSSLTFKHLFPSFEKGLANLAGQLNPGAVVAFDLIEGSRRYFEDDGVTYIRWYERPEIEQIVTAAGLEPAGFDEVEHLPGTPELTRLLVVARAPA